jgi:hypothetical protein
MLQEIQLWPWQGYNPSLTKGKVVNKGHRQAGRKTAHGQLAVAAAVGVRSSGFSCQFC